MSVDYDKSTSARYSLITLYYITLSNDPDEL